MNINFLSLVSASFSFINRCMRLITFHVSRFACLFTLIQRYLNAFLILNLLNSIAARFEERENPSQLFSHGSGVHVLAYISYRYQNLSWITPRWGNYSQTNSTAPFTCNLSFDCTMNRRSERNLYVNTWRNCWKLIPAQNAMKIAVSQGCYLSKGVKGRRSEKDPITASVCEKNVWRRKWNCCVLYWPKNGVY